MISNRGAQVYFVSAADFASNGTRALREKSTFKWDSDECDD